MNHKKRSQPELVGDRFVLTLADGEKLVLQAGMSAPNRRFTDCDLYMIKFAGANLDGCVFENVDLSSVDFSQASLVGAQFIGCILHNAIFIGARMQGAEFLLDRGATGLRFDNADLSGATFIGLRSAALANTIGTGANLFGATFQDLAIKTCIFDRANASSTRWLAVEFDEFRILRGDLVLALFQDCNFDDVYFESSVMCGVNMVDCVTLYESLHLAGADLSGALIERCNFDSGGDCQALDAPRANFTDVRFNRSQFFGADFSGACFEGATALYSGFNESKQDSTCWKRATLVECRLRLCHFDGATLAGAHFRTCSLHGAVFNQAEKNSAAFHDCDFAPPIMSIDETLAN